MAPPVSVLATPRIVVTMPTVYAIDEPACTWSTSGSRPRGSPNVLDDAALAPPMLYIEFASSFTTQGA